MRRIPNLDDQREAERRIDKHLEERTAREQGARVGHEQKQAMIDAALSRHSFITPAGAKQDILDCFTVLERGYGQCEILHAVLWYNAPDGSTHVIMEPLCTV